jgi:uncharacterized protein (TIGR03435 family)
MKRVLLCAILTTVVIGFTFGQSTTTQPRFEAADVHTSPRSFNPKVRGGLLPGGRYELRNATMVDLVAIAYNLAPEKVLGGPTWLESDRFDIVAKPPTSASNQTVPLMLRALLAERFKLAIHNEGRPVSVYALTVGNQRGPQLKQADRAGESGCEGPNVAAVDEYSTVSCHNMTMAALAEALRQWQRGSFVNDPVVDLTDLKGGWDFSLKWTGLARLALVGSDAISLFDALDKQLGLKLDLQKRPSPVIIVDRVNRKPTDNELGIARKLPVVPTEFEAATIKPSLPGATEKGYLHPEPASRIDLQGQTLMSLLLTALDPIGGLYYDDMIVGPKWLNSVRFDIMATTPGAALFDVDTLAGMLHSLLTDRFKIATHYEDQPVTVHALVRTKSEPKLKKADPTSRSSCKRAGPGPVLALAVGITCQNITMAQLAEKLSGAAPGYIQYPVIDSTGLQGGWDFTLTWTGRGAYDAAIKGGDPNGSLSLSEAIEKELALKLELQKRPLPVVVIDHVEQKPTDN